MKKRISAGGLLLAVLKKDARVYSRNTIYLFLTILGLVIFVVLFWIVPDTVDEELPFAISPPLSALFEQSKVALTDMDVPLQSVTPMAELEAAFEEEGLQIIEFENEEELIKAIKGELVVYRTEDRSIIIYDPEGDAEKPVHAQNPA